MEGLVFFGHGFYERRRGQAEAVFFLRPHQLGVHLLAAPLVGVALMSHGLLEMSCLEVGVHARKN